jgi:hypothetical protein
LGRSDCGLHGRRDLFLRYWKLSGDRLFALFSVAFAVMALNWLGLAFIDPNIETRHGLYVLRLLPFVLIIIAVVDTNRRGSQ